MFMKVNKDIPSSYVFFNHIYNSILQFHRISSTPYVQINNATTIAAAKCSSFLHN